MLEFQDELRRVARYDRGLPVANALDSAVKAVTENPNQAQSRLLRRVLTALTYERGQFRRAEAASFDSKTLSIVIALMNAARTGIAERGAWIDAVAACDAAGAA